MRSTVFLTTLVLIFFSGHLASARCNSRYANHLLSARFQNCNGNFPDQLLEWDRNNNYNLVNETVVKICADGCYNAQFDASLKPECDSKYSEALIGFEYPIKKFADKMKCQDQGSYLSTAAPSTAPSPTPSPAPGAPSATTPGSTAPGNAEQACKWVTRYTIDQTCGAETKSSNICGTGGRAICTGTIVCLNEAKVGSQTYQPGNYAVSCMTTSGYCHDKPLSECMSDQNFKNFGDETFLAPEIRNIINSQENVR